jgi:hypothetical protein
MNTIFLEWLAARDLGLALRLLEQTHDKGAYNALFNQQLEDLLRRVQDQGQKKQLRAMLGHDWMGEIHTSLRRAGFGREADELAHDLVVKLLVSPGKLFANWNGQPMEARFRSSVKNAIANVIQKRQTRRRLLPSVPIQPGFDPAMAYMGEPPQQALLIQDFTEFLRNRLGDLGVRVFLHRLHGRETKELFDDPGPGRPTRHRVKQMVKEIKDAARDFAERSGDPAFVNMVQRAMGREAETVGKRRKAVAVA